MTGYRAAGSREETLAFFQGGGTSLFGILTAPTTPPLGVVVILLPAGGLLSTDRNRFGVRLGRRLAGQGFHALRFDYHGVGESEGETSSFRLDEPFTGDLMGAVTWVRKQGFTKIAVVGSCFGARTALASAQHIDELLAVALIAAPVRDYEMGERIMTGLSTGRGSLHYARKGLRARVLVKLADREKRRLYLRAARTLIRNVVRNRTMHGNGHLAAISQGFLDGFQALVDRRLPTLLVYGSDDDLRHEFESARSGRLGELLERGRGSIDLVTVPGEVHGYKTLGVQQDVIDQVTRWLSLSCSGALARTGR